MQNFTELNLSEPILRAISELGYEKPSPIQEQTLPILLGEPTDFLGLAATGTGKTAAFSIPLLERIDPTRPGVQALVLCPTRELAIQVSGQISLMGKYKGIKALPIYGGAGYGDQIRGLRQGVSVVVGTPGRVVDHMAKGTLVLEDVETLILDEADEMISMGFKDDLETVLSGLTEGQSNIWLFSATMSREVRKVADEYLKEPRQVQVNRQEMLPNTVEQIYYATSESNKPEVLCKLIDVAEDFYGIVFCQTKALVTDLHQYLRGRGYPVDCLHGDMDQNARDRTMNAFRQRKVSVLVATDVACRGLDVNDISHVVNYSLPRELDNYVHRIGRTGRIGKTGLALSLVTASHRGLIQRIERMTKTKMKEGKIPTRKEIGLKQVAKSLAQFQAQETFSRAVELLDESWKSALEGMSKEEIAGRFLSWVHPEVFSEREQAEAVRSGSRGVIVREDRSERRSSYGDSDEREYRRPKSRGASAAFRGESSDAKVAPVAAEAQFPRPKAKRESELAHERKLKVSPRVEPEEVSESQELHEERESAPLKKKKSSPAKKVSMPAEEDVPVAVSQEETAPVASAPAQAESIPAAAAPVKSRRERRAEKFAALAAQGLHPWHDLVKAAESSDQEKAPKEAREPKEQASVSAKSMKKAEIATGRSGQDSWKKPAEGAGEKRAGFIKKRTGFSSSREGFGDKREGYGPKRDGYSSKREGYGPKGESFSSKREGFGAKRVGFGAKREGFGSNRDSFGPKPGGFAAKRGGFSSNRDGFGPKRDGFGPKREGYGPKRDGFEKKSAGFKGADGGFKKPARAFNASSWDRPVTRGQFAKSHN